MTIEKHTIITIDPDQHEAESLEIVDNFFRELQDRFKDEKMLVSLNTGEAIEINELARVRGIISAFYEYYHHWQVE